jgi:hypothetical protein
MRVLETAPLQEIGLTKYLPFTVRGRIGSRDGVSAHIKAVDSVVGEIKFSVSLSGARPGRVHPEKGIRILADERITCLSRSLIFTSSTARMGHQNTDTNVSIPFFSTLIKFVTFFIERERAITDWGDRTGMICFTAAAGDSSAHAAALGRRRSGGASTPRTPDVAFDATANARTRVYGIIAKQLEREGLCVVIEESGGGFTVLLKDFADFMIARGLAARA